MKNIYPVEITSADDLSGVFWYDEEGGSQIGRGSLLYLPKGTYYLIGKAINGMEVISQSISFQIVDSKVAVKAENLKKSNMLSGTITLDQAVQVSLKAGNSQIYNYYKFVPEESGTYAFYSESSYADNTSYISKQIDEHEYVLSGRLEIEKVNETFGLDLPESDEYLTVGGLILNQYQSFPKLHEVIRVGRYQFKIIKVTATKIELVRLKVME